MNNLIKGRMKILGLSREDMAKKVRDRGFVCDGSAISHALSNTSKQYGKDVRVRSEILKILDEVESTKKCL